MTTETEWGRKMKTKTGKLTDVRRLNSSSNGNPRFEITLDDSETYRTGIDYSVGYEVSNHKIGSMVTLSLTRHNAVVGMKGTDNG